VNFTIDPVKDPNDRRRVVYWRMWCNNILLGSFSRRDGRWRVLIYRKAVDGSRNTELELQPTRELAEKALKQWAIDHPERITERR